MLNSVLQHVKDVIDGLPLPLQDTPLTARVVPPPVEPLSGNSAIAYVTLASRMTGKRQTMPRGAGFTKPEWPVAVTIDFETLPTDTNLEQAFYVIADAVLLALWADPMPVFITDPTTGMKTQMLAIGEEYSVQLTHVVSTAQGRLYLFRGQVITTVKEATQTGAALTGGGS